jgi:hypothetical protein
MVLDPLTVLSLASNIVQVVDFTGRVIAKCRHIHISGQLPEHHELEITTADLSRISTQLRGKTEPMKPTDVRGFGLSEEMKHEQIKEWEKEHALWELSDTCVRIADDLLGRLNKYKVPEGSARTRWKSFREALETVWKKKDLDELAV